MAMDATPDPGSILVPDGCTVVAYSSRRRAMTRRFAGLILAGARVSLVDRDGPVLWDCEGAELTAGLVSRTQVAVRAPDGQRRYLVGVSPGTCEHPSVAWLRERHEATTDPPRALLSGVPVPRSLSRTERDLRYARIWAPILLTMLATRGVRAPD